MPLPGTITGATDPARLQHGLVYTDGTLVNSPAAHVLVIGVGAYQSAEFATPLKTTIRSARELADWFVADGKARFANASHRLGSVAVVLSETTEKSGAPPTDYAGGPVPRATQEHTAAAVAAWVARINTHKDNLAILYVASHGSSFQKRTAFLLEDYGTREFMVTHGMSEIEQFIGALELAKPIRQLLLFDCCRTPTSMSLPWDEELGKLIALKRDPNDHGEARRQWVICSTVLGDYAEGLTDGRTLFNMALLESLNGVAGDTSAEGWPVRPGVLVDKIDRILGLHRLPDGKPQLPAGRMAGSFEITFPGESTDVPVYITLDDTVEWPDTRIALTVDGAAQPPIVGARGQSPFHLQRMPERAMVEAKAERGNITIGEINATKVRAPATFLTISKSAPVIRHYQPGYKPEGITIRVIGPMAVHNGAIAIIADRSERATPSQEVLVDLADQHDPNPTATGVYLSPGEYTVTVRLPDGSSQMLDFTLHNAEWLELKFAAAQSPREWVAAAAIVGAIKEEVSAPAGLRQDAGAALESYGTLSLEPALPPVIDVSTEVVGALSCLLEPRPQGEAPITLSKVRSDERFERYEVRDTRPSRFVMLSDSPASAWIPPVFVRIAASDGREELAVLPSLGRDGRETVGGWMPAVLVDRQAPANEPVTTVVVEDRRWAALLGFVGSRDFAAGDKLLGPGMSQQAIDALRDKVSNPLAAIAGALIAVANSSPDIDKTWDPWLVNLTNWFPDLPDGPIILGRRRMMRARSPEQIDEARGHFMQGFDRGVPVYSLSVDWLARGLENLPGDDPDLNNRRRAARTLANRVDSGRAFTVVRSKG
jgi:hypothetical protein